MSIKVYSTEPGARRELDSSADFLLAPASWLRTSRRGFSLVEVTIAIAVLTAAVIGITSLTNYSLRLARVARQQLIGANLAQEGMEIVRALRDTNWIATKLADSDCATCPCTASWREGLCNSSVQSYELDYSATSTVGGNFTNRLLEISNTSGLYAYPPLPPGSNGTLTPFRREIQIRTVSAQSMLVTVIVRWCPRAITSCGTTERSITVQDQLYNWFGAPAGGIGWV